MSPSAGAGRSSADPYAACPGRRFRTYEQGSYRPPGARSPPQGRIPWLLIVVAAILFFLGTFGILQAVMGPNSTNGWFDFSGEDKNPQASLPSRRP